MHIQIVPEEEHEQFRNLSLNAKSISSRAKIFLDSLAKADPQFTLLSDGAIVVTPLAVMGEQGQLATVKTPIGNGRATLSYGTEDGQLVGCLIFSRMRFDQHDIATWEPRFTLFVPQSGSVYAKTTQEKFVVSLEKRRDEEFSDSIFRLMLAIIASMVR